MATVLTIITLENAATLLWKLNSYLLPFKRVRRGYSCTSQHTIKSSNLFMY